MTAMYDYHNARLTVNDYVLTVYDLKTGRNISYKVKVDPDCDYVYHITKKQVKTKYYNMQYLIEAIAEHPAITQITNIAGFDVDYSYGKTDLGFYDRWTMSGEAKIKNKNESEVA